MTTPIAHGWPGDLRFSLRELTLRMVPWLEELRPPLGWSGGLDELLRFAADVPPAPTPSPYTGLVARLELTPVEALIALAALSPELDPRYAAAWQVLGGRIDALRPRLATLLHLAPDERDELIALADPLHPLRALGLIELLPARDAAAFDQLAAATPALIAAVLGRELSASQDGVSRFAPYGDATVPAHAAAIAREPIARGRGPSVIILDGRSGSGRGWLASSIAAAADRGTVVARYEPPHELRDGRARSHTVAALARIALLEQLVPVLEVTDDSGLAAALSSIGECYRGPWIVLSDGRPELPPAWPSVAFTTRRPDVSQREALWRRALGGHDAPDELARRFPLGVGGVFRAAEAAIFRAGGRIDRRELTVAARDQLEPRGSLAERVRTERRLTDLVLPPHTRALLDEILAFVRQRRRVFDDWGFAQHMTGGLKVLFSGPPGTGKTMSAQIVAAELDLDLFRIDLSSVVSKWIGETEKNLRRVFDEAESSGGILLFDEADSLFGKRTTDVKSSNDRAANIEVNYLLQRMEQHDGVVLLTTNLETGIDEAFLRRLNFRVRFAAPDADERTQLWRIMIPRQTPVGERLDFALVGEKFDMAGGNIKNAALRAAVLAAGEGSALRTRHLLAAAEREFTEIGRIAR